MDLQTLQYQMWMAVKKYQVLIGRRQEDPHNISLQREILDVLCQLISINENQKLVVAKLREERVGSILHGNYKDRDKNKNIAACDSQHEIDSSQNHHQEGRSPRLSPVLSQSVGSPFAADQSNVASLYPEFPNERQEDSLPGSCEEPLDCSIKGSGVCGESEPTSPASWWCSPEKRLHNFQPPTADYTVEDIHDLVSEDEFMHALGLLTVSECEEVLSKRYERRKHSAYAHIFSSTIWEKPETRRKRRAWLTSGAGSPPNLRRKVRPLSQPPSRPESRPVSPSQSSCSPPTTYLPSQPTSPQSLEEDFPLASQSSEEVCPMCNVKGADVQCDGCGVIYHSHCVDLEDSYPPPCWLCLTCEQLGMRASANTNPQHVSRRREALEVREQLLRQRAELTVAKLQLEERKQDLAVALEAQHMEKMKLQMKEDDVRKAIKQLHNFIYTFQRPETPGTLLKLSQEPTDLSSPDTTSDVPLNNDTSDSALPSFSSSSQSSPVSVQDLSSRKDSALDLVVSCAASSPHQTVLPQPVYAEYSPGSSPIHIPHTRVPGKVIRSRSPSPSLSPDSSSDQTPASRMLVSAPVKFLESPAFATLPFSSHIKREKTKLVKGTLHKCSNLGTSKYNLEQPKGKAKIRTKHHRGESTNPRPKDLSTTSRSRQNGLSRMRRGESKSVTASI